MTDYGQNKDFLIAIPSVDEHPSICGVKFADIPKVLAIAVVPLWFSSLFLSVVGLLLSASFAYIAQKRELEGRPITLSHDFLKLTSYLPKKLRRLLLPSLSDISIPNASYRR